MKKKVVTLPTVCAQTYAADHLFRKKKAFVPYLFSVASFWFIVTNI